jgi:hypothetical protein
VEIKMEHKGKIYIGQKLSTGASFTLSDKKVFLLQKFFGGKIESNETLITMSQLEHRSLVTYVRVSMGTEVNMLIVINGTFVQKNLIRFKSQKKKRLMGIKNAIRRFYIPFANKEHIPPWWNVL